jgi:protein TonB
VELGGAAATDPLTASAVNPAGAPVKAKPSPRPSAERPQPTAESLRPVTSSAPPKLDLRVAGDSAAQPPAQTPPALSPERAPEPAAVPAQETSNPEPAKTETAGGANPAVSEPAPQLPPANAEPAPAARIQPGQLVPIESVDVAPQVVNEVRPIYPPMAMTMGIQGSVTINALISETGDVLQAVYLRGVQDGGLDKAAETAVRKMKFTPARKDGINVRVWKPVTITFRKG